MRVRDAKKHMIVIEMNRYLSGEFFHDRPESLHMRIEREETSSIAHMAAHIIDRNFILRTADQDLKLGGAEHA